MLDDRARRARRDGGGVLARALEGWLFLPDGTAAPPVVVIAPGLGGTKDGFLESFAWTFVERGLAALDEVVPMDVLDDVKCPVLLVAAERDDMVPVAFVEDAHARLRGRSELATFDCGHFDLYVGPAHAENARRQAELLASKLVSSVSPVSCDGSRRTRRSFERHDSSNL